MESPRPGSLWFTAAAVAFAANPHIGTWKLNESKSKFAEGSTKNHTVTYSEGEGGMITVTVDGTDKDGKAVHWTLQGKFDGKPYRSIACWYLWRSLDVKTM